jgi:small-conductance mechanosensitive channel
MRYLDNLFGYAVPLFLQNIAIALIAIVLGLIIKICFRKAFLIGYRYSDYYLLKSVGSRLNRSFAFFVPLFLLDQSLGFMTLSPNALYVLKRILETGLTINFAFILINFLKVLEDVFYHKYDPNKENNLRERKLRTQLDFIRKILITLIILITVSSILLSFESMRQIGKSLLTGVGIGGIVIGFAAQKSLGSLLAGFQIAFTQPRRIDDVLVLNLDYTVPIEPIRTELTRVLGLTELWDKRVNVVHVTDNKDSVLEVRLLISSGNAGNMWDLRCFVREKMIAFIRDNYPNSFPRTRLNLETNS